MSKELIIELDWSAGPYSSFTSTCWLVDMANECGLPVAKEILGKRIVVRPGDDACDIYNKAFNPQV
jgi:hypothetical protein